MHKSILTFGLLVSSLVMLSAMPLFNNNAAFAQGYDTYGDSYRAYPIDDKKYECRTGPFEGFFVSSVEFCKHVKFDKDDRKDNRTGTQDGDGNGVGTNQCAGDVEACFQQFLSQTQFEQLSEALDSPTGVKVDILGSEITLRSFEDICSVLESITSPVQFNEALLDILGDILNPPLNINSALLSCVYEAVNRLN
jgi:hypothetical protein